MLTIHRISDLTLERRGWPDDRTCIHFKLSQPPDRAWISVFKAHAASSVLGAENAIFNGTVVYIEVVRTHTQPELATALDCFIECANLRLRSLPGPAALDRPRRALVPLLQRPLAAGRFRPQV
jgi:hypothetical protein